MPKSLPRVRSSLYRSARLLGDLDALFSLNPKRIARRAVNKSLGRKLVRHLFFR